MVDSRILKIEEISEDDLKIPPFTFYNVLVVSVSHNDLMILNRSERASEFDLNFTMVKSIDDAVNHLKNNDYDIVLLSIDKNLDGYSVIRDSFPKIPIIVMADRDNRRLAETAIEEGAYDFIVIDPSYPVELIRLRLLYSIARSHTEQTKIDLARL